MVPKGKQMRILKRKPAFTTQTFIVQTPTSTKLISAHDTTHAIAISQELAPTAKVQPLPKQTVFQYPFELQETK
jgi:hydroxyacyl-ACP dehydratase HTD2-like protein with hotdog domain